MSRAILPWTAAILMLLLARGALAATSTVVLRVEGRT